MMPTGLVVAFVAVVVATLLILLGVGLIWFIFQRVLPRHQGDLPVAGLSEPAEVVRDRWGVPHIYAQTLAGAVFAQGFVHAQDRLFQMEFGRRLAQGTLAEIFGQALLDVDRWSRIIGLWDAAGRDQGLLGDEERAVLEAYAAGVNAFLDANATRLPAEFRLLGHKPLPWTVQDSLGMQKVLAWGLSQNWESELLRACLLQTLGAERALELEPQLPTPSPTTLPSDGPVSQEALAELASRLLASYQRFEHGLGQGAPAGSNAWAVSGEKTATQRALLANDPHLSVTMPSFWYQNHMQAADGSLHVSGASMAGVPTVLIGHNERIGWGITAGLADNQDLYIEQAHPENPTWFRAQGEWEVAELRSEEIRVRGQPQPHVETVVVTRHGPLISGLLPPEIAATLPPLALRWSGHAPSTASRGQLRLQSATNWASFRTALADIGEPSLNVLYADVDGNIGYQFAGRVPRRPHGHGLVPGPGWDGDHEWEGWIPFDELPSAFNPPQGYLLSANNRPSPNDREHYLGAEWYPGYRATRIERLLQTKPRYTVRDFQRMQTDVYSVQAEALVPYMIMVDGEDPFERRIVRELEAWNLRVEVDSFAAAAYEVARLHLLDLVFRDKLGALTDPYLGKALSEVFPGSGFIGTAGLCLATLLEQRESWWFHDAASGQPRSREALLSLALKRTAHTLLDMIGKDPRKWAWGKVHQVEFSHVLGRGRLLRTIFNRGQYPIGGDGHTVWMTAFDLKLPFGLVTVSAGYRQVLDVGNWDRSTAILATGQSGQPGSPHYADHVEMWREGDQNPMPWSRAAVEEVAESTLWLRPVRNARGNAP